MGMAVFSVFFMQSSSLLAHQGHLAPGHGHGHSNRQMLFGMTAIPSDNAIRDVLDGAAGAIQAPSRNASSSASMRSCPGSDSCSGRIQKEVRHQ